MYYDDITQEEINSVCEWYFRSNVKDLSKTKEDYWKRKRKSLRKKLTWKFDFILAEIIKSMN